MFSVSQAHLIPKSVPTFFRVWDSAVVPIGSDSRVKDDDWIFQLDGFYRRSIAA